MHKTPPESAQGADLRRSLSFWDALALYVGIILGSGIFFAPAYVAAAAPGFMAAGFVWIIGGMITACGAITYAEAGARMPRTGGFYIYYREIYGEAVAFVAGWAALLVTFPASLAAIAVVFGDYTATLLPAAVNPHVLACGAVLLVGLINTVGVRPGALTQRLTTGAKVFALVAICGVAWMAAPASAPAMQVGSPASLTNITAIVGAFMLVLWTYDGWSNVTLAAGELKNPKVTLGRMVVTGTVILVAIYALVQLSVLRLLGPTAASQSRQVLFDAVESGLAGSGPWLAALVALSTLGALNGTVLATGRLGFAMAQDRLMPQWFGSVHPLFQTPNRSIGALIATTLAYVGIAKAFGSLDAILALFSSAVWVFYMMVAWAVLKMRRRDPGTLPFEFPGTRWAPYALLLTGTLLNLGLFLAAPTRTGIGLLLLALGFPVYYLWKRSMPKKSSENLSSSTNSST